MIETAIALTFAHLLADFVLQTKYIAISKHRPEILLLHTLIVAATSWAALGFAQIPQIIAIIAISHAAIDWIKLKSGAKGIRPFTLDQGAHLAVIALVTWLYPLGFSSGIFAISPDSPLYYNGNLILKGMVLIGGLIAALEFGGHAIGALMQELELPDEDDKKTTLRQGGRLIGRLERLLIMMLTLAGQISAIGFLIAAKSVLRFSELSRDRTHLMSEYIIIGTLASFAWGLACAFATKLLLEMLTP